MCRRSLGHDDLLAMYTPYIEPPNILHDEIMTGSILHRLDRYESKAPVIVSDDEHEEMVWEFGQFDVEHAPRSWAEFLKFCTIASPSVPKEQEIRETANLLEKSSGHDSFAGQDNSPSVPRDRGSSAQVCVSILRTHLGPNQHLRLASALIESHRDPSDCHSTDP